MARPRRPLVGAPVDPGPNDNGLPGAASPDAGPPMPDFGGTPGPGMGGGAPMPMGAPGMGGGNYPSTDPALVAQLLGPLLSAQQQDDQRLQQEQMQSVLTVLASMKQSDTASAQAATAPAPIPEDAQNVPVGGGASY